MLTWGIKIKPLKVDLKGSDTLCGFCQKANKEIGDTSMTEENEIALLPNVTFTPAKFEVTNLEELTAKVNLIIEAHKGEIINEENEDQANQDRKQLEEFVDKLSRKRIDTEHELLTEFTPKKKALMKLEKDVAKAADDIKQQTDVFKQKRRAEKLAELRKLIQSFIDEKAKAAGVDPLQIVWSEDWNKSATSQKKIKSDIDEQIFKIVEAKKVKETQSQMIVLMAKDLELDSKAYVQMLDDQTFEVVKSRMEATAADRKRLIAEEEARKQHQIDLDREKTERAAAAEREQMQRQTQQKTDDNKINENIDNHTEAAQKVTQAQSEPNKQTKDKYFKVNVTANQWKFVLAQLNILKENGIEVKIVEPK